jgi:hypothetical protein
MKAFVCAFVLGAVACQARDIPITMCEVLAAPKEHDGKEVTVSGWMVLAFEHASLGCTTSEGEKAPPVWISFDLLHIEKASPQFVSELRSDLDRANRWVGEARRDVVVKGRFRFSEQAMRSEETPPFGGFGHLGSAPGEIVVTEVLQYGPNKTVDPTPGTAPQNREGASED